ncbi:MAG TPA: short chain dehydrogenase [Nitrospira sp.]|nr:short chain dehydrogenase [Nitrospira sp.]HMV57329.1 short chain dehydrogenase [Nitrospira sp.]HMX90858.1 short chain dehydrogenase [Nitrospira sp.]HMZ97628.1 short chain dehydrogenase [Nitrospira sp.]HNA47165.1 short chain dehydrogenase [Nitrospira sp.]
MRVIVIGGTGTIGSAVVKRLSTRHEVVVVGHKKGAFQVDLASPDSITSLFKAIGTCDAVVSTAGIAKFASLDDLTYDDYFIGLKNKLMGQANLVRIGRPFVTDHGSFTLTSGVLSQNPMKGSASISMVNAGLEGFVRAAAIDLPRGLRVNVVSPPWVTETLIARSMDPSIGIPADQVAQAYVASVEGSMTGQTLDPRQIAAT